MSYTFCIAINLGSSQTGLTLNAQLVDTSGSNSGSAITTGFSEIGTGNYLLNATIADAFQGGIKIYANGAASTILAFGAINPAECDTVNEVWRVAMSDLSAVPGITGTVLQAINWLFVLGRNKRTQTATTELVKKDDGTTTAGTSTKSDDGTTFTRGKYS